MKNRLLFVCSRNRLRSPTAEEVFREWPGVETMSAGVNPDAKNPVCADLLDWADVIVVMERSHQQKLSKKFASCLADKRVVVLNIPDEFDFMQPELIELLQARVPRLVGLSTPPTEPSDAGESPS